MFSGKTLLCIISINSLHCPLFSTYIYVFIPMSTSSFYLHIYPDNIFNLIPHAPPYWTHMSLIHKIFIIKMFNINTHNLNMNYIDPWC